MSRKSTFNRLGSVTVLGAVSLTMVFAMVMFTVDLGYMVHVRTELQRQADASALAAAPKLPDRTLAKIDAIKTATYNLEGEGASLNSADVEFGLWDADARTFTATSDGSGNTNSIRVTLKRTKSNNNPLNFFFASSAAPDITAQAVAYYDRQSCGPVVGIESVTGGGSPVVNSYYASPNNGYTSEGNVCSDGPVTLNGNPTVNGDATAGVGYTPSLGGSAVVTGALGSRVKPLNMPPIVVPDDIATANSNDAIPPATVGASDTIKSTLDNKRNLKLVGGISLTIPQGGTPVDGRYVYYLNDLTAHGGSTLTVTQPTTIYLTGDLITSGSNIINSTGDSTMLTIYMIGPANGNDGPHPPTANLQADVDFYGLIYSPGYDVVLSGSAAIYGGVVGKNVTLGGNSGIYYDEALGMGEDLFPMRTALVQ